MRLSRWRETFSNGIDLGAFHGFESWFEFDVRHGRSEDYQSQNDERDYSIKLVETREIGEKDFHDDDREKRKAGVS